MYIANRLITLLDNKRRSKRITAMNDMNFTHSSRKSLALLRNLRATHSSRQSNNVIANAISSIIYKTSNNKPNKIKNSKVRMKFNEEF